MLADVADVTDQEQIEAIMRLVISSPQDESSLRKLLRALVPVALFHVGRPPGSVKVMQGDQPLLNIGA